MGEGGKEERRDGGRREKGTEAKSIQDTKYYTSFARKHLSAP